MRRPARVQAAENRTARLDLTLLDEHGAPTAARVGIFDVGSGREVLASADAVPILRYLESVRDIAVPTSGKLLAQHAARLAAARLPRGRPMRLLSRPRGSCASCPAARPAGLPSLAAAGRRLVARARPPAARSRPASHQSLDGLRERTLWRTCFAGRLRGDSHAWSRVSPPQTTGGGCRVRRCRRRAAFRTVARSSRGGLVVGDAHIHIARGDGGDEAALTIARAEDLHVANLLAMGNIGAQYFAQPHYGPRGRAGGTITTW